jgi:dipeptidyl aminopeptidase/acylaminoacyl peptidase
MSSPKMRHFACAAILFLLPSSALAQEKTVPVPPGIKVEGMPPIPQSIEEGLARYTQFREAELLDWHPTKRQILIQTAFGNYPQIHNVDGPGRARTQLTFLPQPGVSRYVDARFDPADGNTFVFLRDPAGGEARSPYRYDMTTGDVSLVVEAKARYTGAWARQGKWYAYDSSERNGRDLDLYVVQPSDPTTKRRLAELEGAWSPQDWSPDGNSVLAIELVSNTETYLWLIDVKTGTKKALTPRDGAKSQWLFARFSSDGRKVYAVSDKGGDLPRVWSADVATGKWTPVTADTDAVDILNGFELSPDGQMMAVVIDRGVVSELRVIDVATSKARPLPALPRGVVKQLRWRPGSREIGFSIESIRTQGDVYSIDASVGTLTRWTTSEVNFNPETALPPPELVGWKSPDGVAITGILYRPAAKFTGPRPVLINLHGGPALREQLVFRGRSNYFLNDLGVAILYPNVRGSLGFGRAFEQMDNGRGRDGAIKDVGAGLDWIGTRADLDKTRVVLSGGSAGGWLALEAGIVYNDRLRGIMVGAGMTDLPTFLEQTAPQRQENRRGEFGDERDPQMREYLRSISPITRAADLKKPTMIMHPGKDTRVPVAQAQELTKALKANGASVWYLEFSDANHDNFPGGGANNNYMICSWIMFFKAFVLN